MSLIESAATLGGAFNSIPVIDIGNVSTQEQRGTVAREIRDACINVGFFYVSGHGIPPTTIDNIFSTMKTYFSLPLETKMKLYHKGASRFKGYTPALGFNVNPANKGDLNEGFEADLGALVLKANDEKEKSEGTMAQEDIWPLEPTGFREAYLAYYHAAVGVGKLLFRLFALALELPETYFDNKTKNGIANMRIAHYPPQTDSLSEGILGIGAHSDFLCFTILWQQSDVQALQVLNSDKQWINATPIPGTLVINIGDQLAQWTNDIFKSTVHKAINVSGLDRYSIPMFFGTDDDVLIEPISSCISPDRPAKYESITTGDYMRKRFREAHYRSASPS